MKPLIAIVVLCMAYFITTDAAPLGPYQHSSAEAESDEAARLITDLFSKVFSSVNEKIQMGEIQSSNEIASAFKNLLSNLLSVASKKVSPDNKVASTIVNTLKSLVSRIGGDDEERGEVQSSEFVKTLLDGFGDILTAVGKKANPKDKTAQTFLDLADTLLNFAKRKAGIGQAEAEFVTSFSPHANSAVMMEAFADLSEEAKSQFWKQVIGTILSGAINRAMKG